MGGNVDLGLASRLSNLWLPPSTTHLMRIIFYMPKYTQLGLGLGLELAHGEQLELSYFVMILIIVDPILSMYWLMDIFIGLSTKILWILFIYVLLILKISNLDHYYCLII